MTVHDCFAAGGFEPVRPWECYMRRAEATGLGNPIGKAAELALADYLGALDAGGDGWVDVGDGVSLRCGRAEEDRRGIDFLLRVDGLPECRVDAKLGSALPDERNDPSGWLCGGNVVQNIEFEYYPEVLRRYRELCGEAVDLDLEAGRMLRSWYLCPRRGYHHGGWFDGAGVRLAFARRVILRMLRFDGRIYVLGGMPAHALASSFVLSSSVRSGSCGGVVRYPGSERHFASYVVHRARAGCLVRGFREIAASVAPGGEWGVDPELNPGSAMLVGRVLADVDLAVRFRRGYDAAMDGYVAGGVDGMDWDAVAGEARAASTRPA